MANQYTRKSNAHLSETQRKIMTDYIKKHPTATWKEYTAEIGKKAPCSDAFYYFKRREMHGNSRPARPGQNGEKRSYHRNGSSIYNTVWSYPSNKLDETKPLDLLKNFIETINGMKRSRFQLIEIKDPPLFEIRESHR
jgi:hypothetical protein